MAWGGPDEQEAERVGGNPNAKNWHDEALKVVEEAMQVYWNERLKPEAQHHAATTTQQESGTSTLVSEYDQHRRALVEKSVTGWSAELRLYLSDIAGDVTKETDVVAWWAVSAHVGANNI